MSEVIGLRELQKQLENLQGVTPHSLLAGALKLQGYAQENAPVDTGFLRSSALSRETEDGAEVVFQANYAYYVEFGTSKWAGKPYVRPAIDQHSAEIVSTTAEQIQKDIKGLVG